MNSVQICPTYRRSTDGGLTWSPVTNVAAVGNSSDRPGVIIITRPSQSLNAAVNCFKTSDDGLTWPSGLGAPIKPADGAVADQWGDTEQWRLVKEGVQ